MVCGLCSKTSEVMHLDTDLCKTCFCKMLEKRIRKVVRASSCFKPGMNLLCLGELCKHLVEKIVVDPRISVEGVEITMDESLLKKHSGILVIPWTSDHESLYFLNKFIADDGDFSLLGNLESVVKLLLPITDNEANQYAVYKDLHYEPVLNSAAKQMIDELAEKYPQIRYQIGKSVRKLSPALKGKGL